MVPCNVYKNKLLPHYLHYLTTTYADPAKKSEEAVLNRKVAKAIRVHIHYTRAMKIVSSPSLKNEALYLIDLTLLRGTPSGTKCPDFPPFPIQF